MKPAKREVMLTSELLEPGVIRDEAAFLREALPRKYHDFFGRLCLTALSASNEYQRGLEDAAKVCDAHAGAALSGNHEITYAMAVRCAQAIRALSAATKGVEDER